MFSHFTREYLLIRALNISPGVVRTSSVFLEDRLKFLRFLGFHTFLKHC